MAETPTTAGKSGRLWDRTQPNSTRVAKPPTPKELDLTATRDRRRASPVDWCNRVDADVPLAAKRVHDRGLLPRDTRCYLLEPPLPPRSVDLMSQRPPDSPLHLPDLSITRFRGIGHLSIGRLGRVTLLAGRNGVGKTTVLEAVQVFAARGRYPLLSGLLHGRDEFATARDDETMELVDFAGLFHGRRARGEPIAIGPGAAEERVTIQEEELTRAQGSFLERLLPEDSVDGPVHALTAAYRGTANVLPVFSVAHTPGAPRAYTKGPYDTRRVLRRAFGDGNWPTAITCQSLGPGPLENHEIARFWDAIALTDDEAAVLDALRLVMGDRILRVAVIGSDNRSRRQGRAIVRLKGLDHPVPLRSLGDGAVRLFGVALALANSRNGFLLIDEVENGIHYKLQKDFWRMVLASAQALNVQVLATTHSFDCVKGFAEASEETDGVESALVRVDRRDGETWAVEYPEKRLRIAAEQGIEVR